MQLFNDVFKEHQLTATVNRVQRTYGDFLGDLFPVRPLMNKVISIEEFKGSLSMIPFEATGGPGVVGKSDKRTLRTLTVPTLTYSEHISAADVDSVRVFGGNQLQTMALKVTEKMIRARMNHDLTRAHMRAGAIRGEIRAADGTTPYLNLFGEFGITEKVIDLTLGTAGADMREKCLEILRYMEDSIMGDSMSGVMVEMPPELMSRFVNHASIKDIYRGWTAAASQMGGDYRKGFRVGDTGVVFREQRATAPAPGGALVRFIPATEGRAYPTGTANTFGDFVAPADFNSTVNTLGQEFYAKSKPGEWDRGIDILTMSCTMPICMRPEVLVKVISSN